MVEINDYIVLFVLATISLAIIGLVIGFYYFNMRAKNQVDRAHKDTFDIQSAKLAIEKRKEEQSLAKDLKEDNKRLALDVKQSMVNHITLVMNTIKSDMELHKTIILSEINMVRSTQTQLEHKNTLQIEHQRDINQRMQFALDRINQFTWGVDAKSIPPYVTGDVESQEHKQKPTEGIFMSPDSTQTQAMKDKHIQQIREERKEESATIININNENTNEEEDKNVSGKK